LILVEAAVLAVEMGSLKFLEKVSWPSMLLWRDDDGQNLIHIATEKWESEHEVVLYLQEKFNLEFCKAQVDKH